MTDETPAVVMGFTSRHGPQFDALDPLAVHGEYLERAAPNFWADLRVLDVGAGSGHAESLQHWNRASGVRWTRLLFGRPKAFGGAAASAY